MPYLIDTAQERRNVLRLLQTEFAYMADRIDPPSSMLRLTEDDLTKGELWGIGLPLVACVQLTLLSDALYLGKLAVAQSARGKGHARTLVTHARSRATAMGRSVVRLQTRVELVENHAAFAAIGFVKTDETAHEGYDRPTSITMEIPAL